MLLLFSKNHLLFFCDGVYPMESVTVYFLNEFRCNHFKRTIFFSSVKSRFRLNHRISLSKNLAHCKSHEKKSNTYFKLWLAIKFNEFRLQPKKKPIHFYSHSIIIDIFAETRLKAIIRFLNWSMVRRCKFSSQKLEFTILSNFRAKFTTERI